MGSCSGRFSQANRSQVMNPFDMDFLLYEASRCVDGKFRFVVLLLREVI